MGEMIANISHQWKQPLNTINLAVLSARTTENPTKEELEKYFNIIETNVNHLASTINDFTLFIDEKTCIRPKQITEIVKEIDSIIGVHIQKEGINLKIDIASNCQNIMIATSISQVLLNLINNAKDALKKTSKEKNIELKFTSDSDVLTITCIDSGEGIKQEIAGKIFTPYFTTKKESGGTGIGLYMSKQIVKKVFQGTLELDTTCENTCFVVKIPFLDNCFRNGKK